MSLSSRALFGVWFAFCFASVSNGEMTIQEEQHFAPNPLKYNRFAGGGTQFFGHGIDWSGVGRETNDGSIGGISRWVTPISATFYLSADHWAPRTGEGATFYRGNTTSSPHTSSAIGSSHWKLLSTGDLHLGRLTTAVPNDIATYPIYLRPTVPNDYVGVQIHMFGIAGTDNANPAGQKLGRNHTNIFFDLIAKTINYDFTNSGLNPTPEAMARLYDSGGPSFVLVTVGAATKPALFGIHYTGQLTGPVPAGAMGGDSVAGFYKDLIVSTMKTAQSGTAVALRESPIFSTALTGDLDGSFNLNAKDIDLLLRSIHQRSLGFARGYNWKLDFTGDGTINSADSTYLIEQIWGTRVGDVQLDGDVDQSDLAILQAFFGTTVTETTGGWSIGDLNGDGVVNLTDFGLLQANYGWPN